MIRQSLPAALGSTVTRAGLAAGCGGAGSLAALALVHKASAPAIAAGAVATAFAVNAAGPAVKSLAGAIEAISNLLTALIRARADAKATIIRVKVCAELARAGLDPGKTPQAAEMQRVLSANPDLPKGRRPADETLIKLHGASRAHSSQPGTTSGTSPRKPKAAAGHCWRVSSGRRTRSAAVHPARSAKSVRALSGHTTTTRTASKR